MPEHSAERGEDFAPPAPRPCQSCPYRRDVPSGVWDAEEYEKLRAYDLDTVSQPPGLFQCHQTDADSDARRLCAGWVGCHGSDLLGLRWGLLRGRISAETFHAAVEYRSPVPLFESGAAAADHGQTDLQCPGDDAVRAIEKITRRRTDLT
ncbi:DUF6283 family protein [Nocardia brasiliensis]|uniref:DUF6283 family protein n=1 Tax=Nocardia brasiliensis TaxID=37326 RepID=UPI002453CD01|nr:DUF6283 family protein [Nocardia brasiliensis]